MTTPKDVNFQAKKLFGAAGEVLDGSIAYIAPKGGGPTEQHTHEHDHLFSVVKGEAKVLRGGRRGPYSSERGVSGEGQHPPFRMEQYRRGDRDGGDQRKVGFPPSHRSVCLP